MIASAAIRIRPYEEADAQLLLAAARESSADVHRWLPWCRPEYALDDARGFIAAQIPAFRHGHEYEHAIVSTREGHADRFLGGCGLNAIRRERGIANLGYWVRTSERGRGVATRAVQLLVAWARAHTTLRRIDALVAADNAASLRVVEKAGGVRERLVPGGMKLHGVAHDVVVFTFSLTMTPP